MNMPTFKKTLILILVGVVVVLLGALLFRHAIFQYAAETAIRNALPPYVSIERISFNLSESRVSLRGVKVANPSGFSSKYLLETEDVSCGYKIRANGIEVTEPVIDGFLLHLERSGNGVTNIREFPRMLEQRKREGAKPAGESKPHGFAAQGMAAGTRASSAATAVPGFIKFPEACTLKHGRVVFTDKKVSRTPYIITFDGVTADVTVRFDESYTRILSIASSGEGYINNHKDQVIKWNVFYNPTTPALTMSNRFDVYSVEIKTFEPYYDRYSPLVFKSGRFSGNLVFDFDNGNIGSTNEVHLSGIAFWVKQGAENAYLWGVAVPDVVKYFTNAYGDIVFDFKIKGSMDNPQFYFGPITKRALTALAIDKVSEALAQAAKTQVSSGGSAQGQTEQVEAIAGAIQALMKKSK